MKVLSLVLALSAAPAFAAPTATLALIAHNTTHRAEQLANSNRIDPHFVDRAYSVQVTALTKVNPTDPAFKGTLMQVPDASGQAQAVEILLDDAGKALSFKAIPGPESRNAPSWPGVDAISFPEDSMHYLLDNTTKPELKPFLTGLSSVVLTQIQDATNQPQAKVDIRATGTTDILEIIMGTDGKLVSAKVIKQ
jgi:hypothetical protein